MFLLFYTVKSIRIIIISLISEISIYREISLRSIVTNSIILPIIVVVSIILSTLTLFTVALHCKPYLDLSFFIGILSWSLLCKVCIVFVKFVRFVCSSSLQCKPE